ncbi:hypothetical protein HU200_005990 [Digitaria exilis]|uniref:Uncharacterized protein n=1 Tax=Digitaria exilis TaxID=1010633 RepID=A0A835FPV6_9POAL|nr:hypothetical protein HU200_005990 [Digitaria exilis]
MSTAAPSSSGRHSSSLTILATKYSAWWIPRAYPGQMRRPAPKGIILISLLPVISTPQPSPPSTNLSGRNSRAAVHTVSNVTVVSVPPLRNSEQRLTISASVSGRSPPSSSPSRRAPKHMYTSSSNMARRRSGLSVTTAALWSPARCARIRPATRASQADRLAGAKRATRAGWRASPARLRRRRRQ